MKYQCEKCGNPEPCVKFDDIGGSGGHLFEISAQWREVCVSQPNKNEKKPLPEWAKVGAWVYLDKPYCFFGQIRSFKPNGYVEIYCPESKNCGAVETGCLRPACVRPWNNDELRQKVGQVFEGFSGELHLCLGYSELSGTPSLYMAGYRSELFSAKWLLKWNWKFNNKPCGTLYVAEAEKC